MKLKQWLREYCQMTYAEYKALEDVKRWKLEGEFYCFHRNKQIHDSQNWRTMTEEEKRNGGKVYDGFKNISVYFSLYSCSVVFIFYFL